MATHGAHPAYRADIDGLRAFAVGLVLAYHLGFSGAAAGFLGVDVFFVLSGFLITGLIRAEVEFSRRSLVPFWIRRVRRLLPLILLVGLASALAGWLILLPGQLKDFGQSLGLATVFSTNLLFWQEAGYFAPHAGTKPLLHLWSLGVEAQFYLTFPLLLLILPRRWQAPGVAILGLLSLCAALWAARQAPEAAFFLYPFRFWEFAVGALLALVPLRRAPKGTGLAGVGLALVALSTTTASDPHPGGGALMIVVATAMLLHARAGVQRLLRHGALTWLGQRSYGIYLWHFPLIVFAGHLWPEPIGWVGALLIVLASIALSALSLPLVERPLRRPGVWRGLGLGAASLVTMALAVGLHLSAGAPWRLPEAARAPLSHWERWDLPCHGTLEAQAVASGARCAIGDPAATPRIALIGDSHTGHLTPALGPALAAQGQAALVYSRGWCAPLPGVATDAPGRGPECGAFMEAVWAQVLANPQLETIVLAAQWANFTQGQRAGHAAVLYGDATDPSQNAHVFAQGAAGLAERLKGRGLTVIVVESVPEYTDFVPTLLARDAWRTGVYAKRLAPVDYAERNAAVAAGFAQLDPQSRAIRVKTQALFCAANPTCKVRSDDGRPYYRDAAHLSRAGAELVVAELLRLLDTPPELQGDDDDDYPQRQQTDKTGGG